MMRQDVDHPRRPSEVAELSRNDHQPPTTRSRTEPVQLTRRRTLTGSVGILSGLVLSGLGRARLAAGHVPEHSVPPDPTKVLGHSSSAYGFRSQFEGHVVRQKVPIPTQAPAASWTPLHDARGIITPSALHYEVHHGGVPIIDPSKHTLIIHGLVERPLKLTLNELMRFPAVNQSISWNALATPCGNGASPCRMCNRRTASSVAVSGPGCGCPRCCGK